MKKKHCFLMVLLLSLLLSSVYAATDTTLSTQPPSDTSDCQAAIEDSTNVGWIHNGYVRVSFNTTDALNNITFYRGVQPILTLDLSESYINKTEYGAPPPAEQERVGFYKLQWYNHTSEGWDPWAADTGEIPDDYFAYRQQIIVRAIWQDDPVTPWYVLVGVFTVTRGMPWVQVEWQLTNNLGVAYDLEFVPSGLFYIPTDQTVLSSDLQFWNESTYLYDTGTVWGRDAWFTVGFTHNGSSVDNPDMKNNTRIFYNNTGSELLNPLPYEAVAGNSAEAYWVQNFTAGEPTPAMCEYNYTFFISNIDSTESWHIAELFVPQSVVSLTIYYSTDNGTTWETSLGYNWNTSTASGTETMLKSTNDTIVNATIYTLSTAGGSGANVSTSINSDCPTTYYYSSLQGVHDRVAIGVLLEGYVEDEDIRISNSTCFFKVQVQFTGNARYWFEYGYSEFETEPDQGYGLLNQTDGRLCFVTSYNSTAPGWAIGMNQTLRDLRITSYPNRTLQNVLFGWNLTLADEETGAFTMNVFGFLSLDTNTFEGGDDNIPNIFEFGSDTPRFQIHEALVKTTFQPLQTYLPRPTQRRYILNWTQTLTGTDWDSIGNYTVALVEYNRANNGWAPITTPTWVCRRSTNPVTDMFDSFESDSVEFYLTPLPPADDGTMPVTTPPAETPPPLSIIGISVANTWVIITVAVIVAMVATVSIVLYRKYK